MMRQIVAVLLLLVYSQASFSMTESELTTKAPACNGRMTGIPQDARSDPIYGLIHSIDWTDIDADGQCDIVDYTQQSMDDEGEETATMFMSRGNRYVRNLAYNVGRTLKVIPIYLKAGGPPYLVIHKTQSKGNLPDHTVWRWNARTGKVEWVEFHNLSKYNVEHANDVEANTVMLFYVRNLIETTSKSVEQNKQPGWVYDEIYALSNTVDNELYPELSKALVALSDKVLRNSK
jgi:hypothetical protein